MGDSDTYVGLSELFEVRVDGLEAGELLAVLSAACEFLIRAGGAKFGGIFTQDTVFLTRMGEILIEPIPPADVADEELIPPEIRRSRRKGAAAGAGAAAVVGEPQLVWCLGEMTARAARPALAGASLISLLNLMTLGADGAAGRPTLAKLAQMVRNQSRADASANGSSTLDEAAARRARLVGLYQELMGDVDELINDQFGDDIRCSSTRSSLSIVSGAWGGRRASNASADSAGSLAAAASMRRRRNEMARRMAAAVDLPFDDKSTPPASDDDDDDEEGEEDRSTIVDETEPRPTTPRADVQNNSFSPANRDGHDNLAFAEPENRNGSGADPNDRPPRLTGATVEVEVHTPRADALGEYVALTNAAHNYGNVVSARKKSGAAAQTARQKSDLEQFLNGLDKIEPYELSPPPAQANGGGPSALDNAGFEPSPPAPARPRVSPAPAAARPAGESGFSRQNSLQPAQIHRRASGQSRQSRRPAAGGADFAVPEFLAKSAMPLIRLRATSMKRRRVSLHRQDDALVLVKLLTGQCVEVNCKTDALVSSVFDTVAAHLNITEHIFFGLALLKNSEYYFLDADRRLEKWAPAGWKSSASAAARHQRANSIGAGAGGASAPPPTRSTASLASFVNGATAAADDYCLHLRFRYYPRKLEFVKTESTTHNLYLQLRQDILDGVLRFNDAAGVELACELAALALQAEFGAAPPSAASTAAGAYFKMDNYLPTNFYAPTDATASASLTDLESRVCACHAALGRLAAAEAERAFIARCQAALGYGAHYYRVSKIKPSSSRHIAYFNRLADIHRLAIMPLGIAICREQTTTGARHVQAAYEWHAIRTLQFDRTRVLISTVEGSPAAAAAADGTANGGGGGAVVVDHVFYTDHYSKSAYLVRFAASQHRFMIKMRHWQSTLLRAGGGAGGGHVEDVGAIGGETAVDGASSEKENFEFPKIVAAVKPKESIPNGADDATVRRKNSRAIVEAHLDRYAPGAAVDAIEASLGYGNGGGGEAPQRLHVALHKHPRHGLGLTLVDGAVNGVRGIYVKSVAEEGDGRRQGLQIGDCLLSIDGVSLADATRHDAVELVRKSGERVDLELLRFPSITDVLTEAAAAAAAAAAATVTEPVGNGFTAAHTTAATVAADVSQPQKPKRMAAAAARYNQRAVSDFGAIGDHLPVLNSDELIIQTMERRRRRKGRSSLDISSTLSPSGSGSSSSDTDTEASSAAAAAPAAAGSPRTLRRGRYDLGGAATSMYDAFHAADDDVDDGGGGNVAGVEPRRRRQNLTSSGAGNKTLADMEETISWATTSFDTTTLRSYTSVAVRSHGRPSNTPKGHRKNTLDWTNDLSDISDGDDAPATSPRAGDVLQVEVCRAFVGQPLGFQVGSTSAADGSGETLFLVKQITAMPASGANLRVDDVIRAINGSRLAGCGHERVVALLRTPDLRVILEVERRRTDADDGGAPTSETLETLRVQLDKSQSSSIGLSLAKRMGHDGIFIRGIAPGSLADSPSLAADGARLRVGDRLWAIDGADVSGATSAEIVRQLTAVNGVFEICVKRIGTNQTVN